MKLLKKLLPIASLASVAAVAAPLATSCSTGSLNSIEYTAVSTQDKPADPYVAMFDPHEPTAEAIDKDDALSIYLDKMSEDVRVFADDKMFTLNHAYANLNKSSKGAQMYAKATIDNYDKEEAVISFTMECAVNFDSLDSRTNSQGGGGDSKMQNYNYVLQFKNFPLDVVANGYYWYLSTTLLQSTDEETYVALADNEDWSISFAQYVDADDCHMASSIYWDHKNLYESGILILPGSAENASAGHEYFVHQAIREFFYFESHYLQKEGVQA